MNMDARDRLQTHRDVFFEIEQADRESWRHRDYHYWGDLIYDFLREGIAQFNLAVDSDVSDLQRYYAFLSGPCARHSIFSEEVLENLKKNLNELEEVLALKRISEKSDKKSKELMKEVEELRKEVGKISEREVRLKKIVKELNKEWNEKRI
ncbi:hypothetical protein BDFG_01763 [Blastomyces dermatitidis ATCC 26199]|nr:hypothetical protein BDFG_01763 [Blastomyces dermatitidis ATCC 26199]